MKIVEIFSSIEGEGSRSGYLCTFIRKYGCNLRCSYCDSQYACTEQNYIEMSVQEIMDKVHELGNSFITITGGEPLYTDGSDNYFSELRELVSNLSKEGYFINIETNGSISPLNDFDDLNVFYTIDYKCSGSGMEDRMLDCGDWSSLFEYGGNVLKFVVGSVEEIEKADKLVRTHIENPQYCSIYLSPVFGKIEPKEIVETMKRLHMDYARIQLQMHKFIWPADMRGV